MAHTTEDFWRGALTAIANGYCLQPLFAHVGINNITQMLGWAASFGEGRLDEPDVQRLSTELAAAAQHLPQQWEADPDKASKYLRTIILHARNLAPVEAKAAYMPPPAPPAEAPSQATPVNEKEDAKANLARAKTAFEIASEVFPALDLDADKRVKYEIIGNLQLHAKKGEAVAYGLSQYVLNLSVSQPYEESYEIMGRKWTTSEVSLDKAKIKTFDDLIDAMRNRMQAKVVSGTWDIFENARKAERDPPEDHKYCPESKVTYIKKDGTVGTMHCFATPKMQVKRIEAMIAFSKKHPHVAVVSGLVDTIDARIEKQIANFVQLGYTEDEAVRLVIVKSPENHNVALIGSSATASTSSAGETSGLAGDKRKGRDERSIEERYAAQSRAMEQKEKQIANLKDNKHGKGGGKGGKGGGGGDWYGQRNYHANYEDRRGGGYYGGGSDYGGKGGKGGGHPGPRCPPDVCKNFNFKGMGCTGTACRFKHECAECGAKDHGWYTCPKKR
jgi:uncharacterized membrane protein YgcG